MAWFNRVNKDSESSDTEIVEIDIFDSPAVSSEVRMNRVEAAKASSEMETVREERDKEEKSTSDQEVVVVGAKVKFNIHLGEFKVLSDVPTTQDKLTGTIVEKQLPNFTFYDGFILNSLATWQDFGTYKVQDNEVLIKKSKINGVGIMPGSSSPETGIIEFIHSGQVNAPAQINTLGKVVPENETTVDSDYVIQFSRPEDYDGEFGFDWMRKEYLPIAEGGGGICIEGLQELKKIYTPFKTNVIHVNTKQPYGDYYVPWLAMFPNHKDKIGKEVRLILSTDLDYDNSDDPTQEQLKLESENPVIKVTPDTFMLFDLWNGGAEIVISCEGLLTADTVVNVKSSNGKIVGKLNVMKNSDHEDFVLNIHLINAYVSGAESEFGKSVIDKAFENVGGIKGLEKYLNTKSLNQALIQVKLHLKEGTPYDWAFSRSSLESANRGNNPQNDKKNIFYNTFEGMIKESDKMLFEDMPLVNFFNLQFTKAFPSIANSKSIFLYLTSLQSFDSGGVALITPLHNKHCIIFKSNLENLSTYAHEIAHTLGVSHSFPAEISYKESITNAEENIQSLNNWFIKESDWITNNPKDERIKYYSQQLKKWKDIKIGFEEIKKYDIIKYEKSKTDNFMDYSNKRESFYKSQSKVMQNEVKKYYH